MQLHGESIISKVSCGLVAVGKTINLISGFFTRWHAVQRLWFNSWWEAARDDGWNISSTDWTWWRRWKRRSLGCISTMLKFADGKCRSHKRLQKHLKLFASSESLTKLTSHESWELTASQSPNRCQRSQRKSCSLCWNLSLYRSSATSRMLIRLFRCSI